MSHEAEEAEEAGEAEVAINQAITAFEERYGYDATYMRYMHTHTPATYKSFSVLSELVKMRQAAPVTACYAAKLVGAMAEDCGPCLQLTVDMAREDGMTSEEITAVLTHQAEAMKADTRLGFEFAHAVLNRASDLEHLREQVRLTWGEAGVVDLTIAVQIGRVFPMMKAGLGFDQACQQIVVNDCTVDMVK